MKKLDGSITTNNDISETEDFLFTYSEKEKQDSEINSSNASLVFSPKFIPVYPDLIKAGFSLTEATIFGFIDFYKSTSSNRFYFTNEQIAEIVGCNPDTVSRCISKLESKGLLKTSRKVRAGGGLIRFVTDIFYISQLTLSQFANRQKLQTNKNKINNNKINNNRGREKISTPPNKSLLTEEDLKEISSVMRVPLSYVVTTYEKVKDYQLTVGKPYKDESAAVRNWIRRDLDQGRVKKDPVNEFKKYVDVPPPNLEGLDKLRQIKLKSGLL